MSEKSRCFLFVLWEGGGNVPPILGLARALVERGHRVRVISDPCNEHEVHDAGCEFVSYKTAPHRHDKSASSTLVKDYEARNPLDAMKVVLDHMACGPSLEYARDVLDTLVDYPADAVVVSELLFGGCFAAEVAQLPCVMLIPGTYTFPAPGLPPPGMMPMSGPAGWLLEKLSTLMFKRLLAYGLPALNSARSTLGLPSLTDISTYLHNYLARLLVMTSPTFDFSAQLPANVRYVGPVLDDPFGPDTWEQPWPAGDQRPLVVAGFSTTYQQHETLMHKVVEALGQTSYRGLVTLGPALNENHVPTTPNVASQPFVRHSRVFPQASAVVTHGGHGTVIRALAYGIPLVCIPIGRDQPANAARVVYHGAGVRLKPSAQPTAIAEAIREVVEKPIYRKRAQWLAAHIQKESQWTAGVEELEQVARSHSASIASTNLVAC